MASIMGYGDIIKLAQSNSGQDIHNGIELDRQQEFPKPDLIRKYRDYAMGKHDLIMSQGQEQALKGLLDNDFCDNIVHQIISAFADRVEFLRYDTGNKEGQKFLEEFILKNDLLSVTGSTHYAAARDGNYCVLVSWDDERKQVVVNREPWWNGKEGVFVAYDAQDDPLYAVKDWIVPGGFIRRLIWIDNLVMRFINNGGGNGFEPFALGGGDGEAAFEPWVKADGISPLHIPFIHFAMVGRGPQNYGISEAAGGVLGFQDRINDIQNDIVAAARMTGFQMLWTAGFKFEKNTDGTYKMPSVAPGAVFTTENPDGKMGIITAGDISQLINAYMHQIRSVARMTRTPLHIITGGDWPSGEALIRSEMPLIGKVKSGINAYGTNWNTVAHRAMEISNAFGGTRFDENEPVSAIMEKAEQRDPVQIAMADQTFWTAAQASVTAGLPLKVFLQLQGWSSEQLSLVPENAGSHLQVNEMDVVKQQGKQQEQLQAQAQTAQAQMLKDNPPKSSGGVN